MLFLPCRQTLSCRGLCYKTSVRSITPVQMLQPWKDRNTFTFALFSFLLTSTPPSVGPFCSVFIQQVLRKTDCILLQRLPPAQHVFCPHSFTPPTGPSSFPSFYLDIFPLASPHRGIGEHGHSAVWSKLANAAMLLGKRELRERERAGNGITAQ